MGATDDHAEDPRAAPTAPAPASPAPAAPRRARGRLTIFLGAGPGSGKTARLRDETAALVARGADVAVGWGRIDVAGADVVPPLRTGAHGLVVEELDVEGVLARAPSVCVVDDLAHTNAPGGRRLRRHDDVEAILAAGIDVVTAADVNQVEGLATVVQRIPGAEVRESIPDAVLRGADEVVCVDVPVEDVLRRTPVAPVLRDARTALRELALREVAEWISRRRAAPSAAPPGTAVGDRVLACVASASPRAEAIVRRAAAIAGRLSAHWFVAHVERPGGSPDVAAQRVLARTAGLARELGAEVVNLRSADPVAAVVDFARSHGVTHVVVGRSARPAWRRLVGGTFVSRLLDEAHDLDVHVVARPDGAGR